MPSSQKFVVIGGNGNHDLDKRTVKSLNEIRMEHRALEFLHLDIDEFPDREPDLRFQIQERIEGRHAILFQSIETVGLMEEMLILAWGIKNKYGAQSLTAVLNFFRYRRQDHPEKIHEIPASHMLVDLLVRGCGVDRIIFCEIHSQATLDYCRQKGIEAWNVNTAPVFAAQLRPFVEKAEAASRPFRIHAPDVGSIPRAIVLAQELGVGVSATPKRREHDGKISMIQNSGILSEIQAGLPMKVIFADEQLRGSHVCIFDDELSSGSTGTKNGRHLLELGVERVCFAAAHPVCVPGWKRKFVDSGVFQPGDMFLGNTLDRSAYKYSTGGKVVRVNVAPVIARALHDEFIAKVSD